MPNKRLGNLLSYSQHETGISAETSHGKIQVTVFSDSIVRVHAVEETFNDFSYAVIAKPQQPSHFKLIDEGNTLLMQLNRFSVKIGKNPVHFTFLTPDNRIINEDDSFGISWNGEQVACYKKLQDGERFIGLGEKTGGLDRRGSGYQNWNTDSYAFSTIEDPLYCSTPFYMGLHHGLAYGIFFDNSHKTFFNFAASNNRFSSFCADAGDMNYYFIHNDSVADIIRDYTFLTGRIEMPPSWSIGYQQCRYSYYPEAEVVRLAETFREKDIPADVIVLDIHYMDNYKIFTWSKRYFPEPSSLIEKLSELGFKVVVICDPGIKIENGYHCYDDGIRSDVFLKYPDGSNYSGQVWPGWCHFPDFTSPETRAWWKKQMQVYTDLGISGFWNDMNEIATWGNMVPENIEFDFDGKKGTMREGRNIYGFQMARSTYEGAKALLNGKRTFNLSRSGYSGIQRYAAVWTGDNVSYDEHMILGARMISNMGLAGLAFAGYDVGGFVGEASAKLFARWISIGAFSPFFRGHTMINSRDSEPWSYGEEVEQLARNYIRFRYQLFPYIYSLFYEATETGMPIQRSLAINYPFDSKIYDSQYYNQYLFGPYILVCPVESTQRLVKIYLPEGDWYYLYDGRRYQGAAEIVLECPLDKLPVFVKASGLIPMQPVRSSITSKNEILFLHVYSGSEPSSFVYYEDDGDTYAYQKGDFHKRQIDFHPHQRTVIFASSVGRFESTIKKVKVIFHSFTSIGDIVSVNGSQNNVLHEECRYFTPLEKFDPFYDPTPEPPEWVRVLEFGYSKEKIALEW
ncbi:MAG TPA: glycoside hydrolase family 31 protein [Cyclobacteriaceae bacterium]|nr:glycoside hydrolase family 31 protein [Cyclobacteriaceae bacterium]